MEVWMGKEACVQGACSEQMLARVDLEKRSMVLREEDSWLSGK